MNTFNKLYNLIIESIITQDIESKIKKAIQTLIKSGQLKDQNDPRVQQVKTIIKRNSSIDINGKTKLDQLLKQNEKYLDRAEANKDNYLDSIPQFSQKKQYPNGVVIYRVEDSRQAQKAVRKLIDANWGEDADPWCLAAGHDKRLESNYNSYWMRYNSYPKHIAFQNGKLLAFCANSSKHIRWWDRNDKQSEQLKLLDGSFMQTDYYGFTKEQQEQMKKDIIKKWMLEHELHLNPQTGRYDVDGDLYINDSSFGSEIRPEPFPIKFGTINGSLYLGTSYTSNLEFMPKLVKNKLDLGHGLPITSLKGLQDTVVEGAFEIHSDSLTSLEYAPKLVKGWFCGNGMQNLKSLNNFWERVQGKFECLGCPKLNQEDQFKALCLSNDLVFNKQTQKYDSKGNVRFSSVHIINSEITIPLGIINGNFEVFHCELNSLKNFPSQVKGNMILRSVRELKTLKGMPKHVGGQVRIEYCRDLVTAEDYDVESADGLVTYQGCIKLPTEEILTNFYNRSGLKFNKETKRFDSDQNVKVYYSDLVNGQFALPLGVIKGNFEVQEDSNKSFLSLHNGPTRVEGNFKISHNPSLKSLQYAPEYVGGDFDISYCYKITSLSGGPKYVGGTYNCHWCHRLQTLDGIPETINGDLYLTNCKNLQNLNYAPKVVKGKVKISGCKYVKRDLIDAYKKQIKENNKVKK